MNDTVTSTGEPASVLVVAPNWLGDAVMALPAIADVRRRFRTARLTVAARAPVAGLFRLTPFVDQVQTLEWRGGALRPLELRDDVRRLRELRAEVAILLPNSFASAWLVARAGVPGRWGYAADMRRWLLSRAIARPTGSMHQAQYYQHLVRALGIETGPLEPLIAVPPDAMAAARGILAGQGWDGMRPVVAVAPGAAYGTAKRWLPSHFGRLIGDLVTERGAACVLIGSAADRETIRLVRRDVPAEAAGHVIDLAGQTTLEMLAGVLALAEACVSNDSGAMHLAAAVGVPLAALFGPTNERETSPLARNGVRLQVLTNPVECRPCMLRECPIDHPCMKGLEPARVLTAIDELIAGAERAWSSRPRAGESAGAAQDDTGADA